ncbi:unnamed protein product [Effrenium voratum]|nr:unnamed protein product [Effrenium voratum]
MDATLVVGTVALVAFLSLLCTLLVRFLLGPKWHLDEDLVEAKQAARFKEKAHTKCTRWRSNSRFGVGRTGSPRLTPAPATGCCIRAVASGVRLRVLPLF